LHGLQSVAQAFSRKGLSIYRVLQPCLFIHLLWLYVRWRRLRPTAVVKDKVEFFELQAAVRLREQFERHINALDGEYSDAWSGESESTGASKYQTLLR